MLKLLIKKQLYDLFRSFFYDQKKNVGRSKLRITVSIVLYALLIVGMLGGIFTAMCVMICYPLTEAGLSWLYFAIASLVAIVLGVFGSVFNTYSSLYLAKDNDLLLSMPIPVTKIMIARLMGVFIMGSIYSCVVSIPAAVVYWINVPQTAASVVGSLLLVVIITLIVLLLSCLLGYVVARVSVKTKNKSFVTVLASLCFIAAYYFVYFKALNVLQNITGFVDVLAEKLSFVYLLGSVGTGDVKAMVIVSVVVAGLIALVCWRIVGSFLKVATASGAVSRVKEKTIGYTQSSQHSAFLKKEFGRLVSSANYMLNCALGTLFMVIVLGLLIVKGPYLSALLGDVFGEQPGFIAVLVAAACCCTASMNDSASASVSLEGKNVWIPRSMPVDAWTVLRSKLDVQILITAPLSVILCIFASVVFKLSIPEAVIAAAVVLTFDLFSAMFGLFMNLRHPNMDWSNEIYPIKQSLSVGIALLVNFAFFVLLVGVYLILGNVNSVVYLSAALLLSAVLCVLLYLWLRKRGTVLFEEL